VTCQKVCQPFAEAGGQGDGAIAKPGRCDGSDRLDGVLAAGFVPGLEPEYGACDGEVVQVEAWIHSVLREDDADESSRAAEEGH
jgi:hypothetical protein